MTARVAALLLAAIVVTPACTKPADDGAAGRVLPGGLAGPGTPPAGPLLPPGGDFTLTGPGGKPYALADARGSAVVLFFGYASCPDFCPRAMGLVKGAVAKLDPAQAARVRPIFVSVDPDRDTPASLERYLQHLVGTPAGGLAPIGVTGTHAQLHEVIAPLRRRLRAGSGAAGHRLHRHASHVALRDRSGRPAARVRLVERGRRSAGGRAEAGALTMDDRCA